ncbi:MAG TPA: ATP-binding protein [Cytophagaceae bacterium]|jgi:two-component system phosphate regulon sensor histidine kinase PhoR
MSTKERSDSQKTLIELNEEMENYFKCTIIPQLFVDANLILRRFTPPAMKQFNFKSTDVDRPIEEIVDNIKYSTIIEDIKEGISTGEILEKEIQTTDLSWYQLNVLPYIIQKEKKTNGVIITFIDITKRIKALAEAEKLNQNLIKLNADHDTFIYTISHDLKGPLQNIEGLNSILMEAIEMGNGNDIKAYGDMLNMSVRNMRKIIDELTDITKVKGDFTEETELVNLMEVMEEVELTLKNQIFNTRAKVVKNFEENEINFSRKNIRSILYNLLSNAIKYKAPDRIPEITITTKILHGSFLISFSDNGLGIPDDQKDSIFEQFSRVEKGVEGMGIGLYIVKRIIVNNKGKITVETKLDKGTEFKIYLNA